MRVVVEGPPAQAGGAAPALISSLLKPGLFLCQRSHFAPWRNLLETKQVEAGRIKYEDARC